MRELQSQPHRRYNPLAREWVLVSPRRTERPWQGQVESMVAAAAPAYDPSCYLCPGNARHGEQRNPPYAGVYVFDNDFPTMTLDSSAERFQDGLLIAEGERGVCHVVCYTPRHDLTLARLPQSTAESVVGTWVEQYRDLGARKEINSVLIFENRGAMMGASNPHPHGQIWANEHLPNECLREQTAQLAHRTHHGNCLLCEYVALELARGERIVCANDGFVALVPFWAVWPFEVMVLSRAHRGGLDQLEGGEPARLADILRRVAVRYDNLFTTAFPFSMGIHQKPTDGAAHPEWHMHAHFLPPLLRSATVRKHLVGYELMGTPQRDFTPESAAERLRAQSEVHWAG